MVGSSAQKAEIMKMNARILYESWYRYKCRSVMVFFVLFLFLFLLLLSFLSDYVVFGYACSLHFSYALTIPLP